MPKAKTAHWPTVAPAGKTAMGQQSVELDLRAGDPVRVIMVHGTWGRGFWCNSRRSKGEPWWFERHSGFAQHVGNLLEVMSLRPVIEKPLLWSGRNSLLDRGKAAMLLAKRIRRKPGVACLVIAHSYAGNAVLRAMKELNEDEVSRVRFLALSTPFVTVVGPGLLPDAERTTVEKSKATSRDERSPQRVRYNRELMQLSFLALLTAFMVATVQVVVPDIPLWVNAIAPLLLGVSYMVSERERTEGEALADSSDMTSLARRLIDSAGCHPLSTLPHMLILRGVEDEAALLIDAAGALGRTLQIVRTVTLRLLYGRWRALKLGGLAALMFALSVGTFSVRYGFDTYPNSELRQAIALGSMILWVLILLVPWIVTAASVLSRIASGMAVGRELMWLPNLEVSMSTAPDLEVDPETNSTRFLGIRTVARRGRTVSFFRHSIYDERGVALQSVYLMARSVRLKLPDLLDEDLVNSAGRSLTQPPVIPATDHSD